MKKLLLALTLLAGCSQAVTISKPTIVSQTAVQTIPGHDFLGAGNRNIKASTLIQGIENGVAIGFFSNDWPASFGNPYPTIRQVAQSGKVKLLRGQCYWSYQHKPAPLPNVKACADKLEKLAVDFTAIRVLGSPSCEYDKTTTTKQLQAWAQIFKNRAPHVQMVLTPMGGPVLPGYLVERHGDKVKGAKAISTDGQNIFDANAAQLIKDNPDAEYILGWGLRYNLSEAGTNPPPAKRTAAPSVQYIRSIGALFHPKISGSLKAPQLYKTHAEDQLGEADPRANRPLFIIKEKVPFIEILDSRDSVLGKFPFYDSYLSQGYRYYSGSPGGMRLYGYEIGDLARQRTGSDAIKIRITIIKKVLIRKASLLLKAKYREDRKVIIYDVGSAAFRTPYYQQ